MHLYDKQWKNQIQEMPNGYLVAPTVMTLGICQRHSSIASFFYTDKCVLLQSFLLQTGMKH